MKLSKILYNVFLLCGIICFAFGMLLTHYYMFEAMTLERPYYYFFQIFTYLVSLSFFVFASFCKTKPKKEKKFPKREKMFEDTNLEKAVRSVIYKAEGKLYTSDVEDIKILKCENYKDLEFLSGIEYLKRLEELDLWGTKVVDISPIAKLLFLKKLSLWGTNIFDISSLHYLNSLNYLYLQETKVRDVTVLKRLKNLKYLNLASTPLLNTDALEYLENLEFLNLEDVKLKKINFIKGMKNLIFLDLSNTEIEDISNLKYLKNLENLNISKNKIENIEVLLSLPKLQKVNLIGVPTLYAKANCRNVLKNLEKNRVEILY